MPFNWDGVHHIHDEVPCDGSIAKDRVLFKGEVAEYRQRYIHAILYAHATLAYPSGRKRLCGAEH